MAALATNPELHHIRAGGKKRRESPLSIREFWNILAFAQY
jgi:hypothetical protein